MRRNSRNGTKYHARTGGIDRGLLDDRVGAWEGHVRRGALTDPGVRSQHMSADRIRILIADDHEIVREGLRMFLAEEPEVLVVGEASNGLDAIELALKLRPDVV